MGLFWWYNTYRHYSEDLDIAVHGYIIKLQFLKNNLKMFTFNFQVGRTCFDNNYFIHDSSSVSDHIMTPGHCSHNAGVVKPIDSNCD